MAPSRAILGFNYQPRLDNPLLQLSGAAAQQELSEAASERIRSSSRHRRTWSSELDLLTELMANETTANESSQDSSFQAEEPRNRPAARPPRARLLEAVFYCRQYVLMKWLIEALSIGSLSESLFLVLLSVAASVMLSVWPDETGSSLSSWFNSALVVKIFRCLSHVNEEGRTVMTVCLFLFSICSVVLMNQKFSFVFNYIVVFIEMAVLVQAGNF
ncbi:hypothetical protein GUITHDRAFT_163998, partial [Guillardia theta CCMP2712]